MTSQRSYSGDAASDGWQPIETAPKDGRVVLLGAMENGELTQVAQMQWSHIQRNGLFPGVVGMWVCPGSNFTWNPEPAEYGPTHWKPVAPPATSLTHAARAEPFIYVHELLSNGGGVWIGCKDRDVLEASHTPGETGEEIIALYAEPALTHAYAEGRADEREEAASLPRNLHTVVRAHIEDLKRVAAILLVEAPSLDAAARECLKAADELEAALSSPSPAREEATTEREEAKKARPPSDAEPWVVADDTGVRVTFSTEDAAWRYRNEYTNRLENPTVTHEAGEDARDAARWRAVASAVSELTLMLHYSRPDQRASIVDAALAADQMNKEHGNAPAA